MHSSRILKLLKAHYCIPGQDDQEEQEEDEDENTVINVDDNGAGQEIPQEEENVTLNQEENNSVPSPPRSPRNLIESSKSVRI